MSREIRFEPHDVGALLTEVTRVYLAGGTPSALLSRIRHALVQRRSELPTNHEDAAFLGSFIEALDGWRQEWIRRENETYGGV